MDTQRDATTPAAAPVPGSPAVVPCAAWPLATQLVFACLLGVALGVLACKSWLLSLEAGPSTLPSQRIDLNIATHAELRLLPGIGDNLAERIAKLRADKGPFEKVDDLRHVPGIGPATLERLRSWVFVSASRQASAKDPSLPLTVEPTNRLGAKPRKGSNLSRPLDINTASPAELMQIPGIGPKLSQRIVEERGRQPFQAVADLRRVYGIGPKILEKMRPYVTVAPVEITRGSSAADGVR